MGTAETVAIALLAMVTMMNIGLIATDMWLDSEAPGKLDIFYDTNGLGPFTYEDLNSTAATAATYAGCDTGDWVCNIVKGASSAIDTLTFGLPQFSAWILWLVNIAMRVSVGWHFAIVMIAEQIEDAAVRYLLYGFDAIIFIVWIYGIVFGIFKPAASIIRGGGG